MFSCSGEILTFYFPTVESVVLLNTSRWCGITEDDWRLPCIKLPIINDNYYLQSTKRKYSRKKDLNFSTLSLPSVEIQPIFSIFMASFLTNLPL